mgnify:CR=1 FL=1
MRRKGGKRNASDYDVFYIAVKSDTETICFGEVGLSGEVRAVSMAEQRVTEANKTWI